MCHTPPLRALIALASIALAIALFPSPAFSAEETMHKTKSLRIPQALAAAGFTKFATMIKAAGLEETFEIEGPYTCFAPTNKALDSMPEARKNELAKNPKSDQAIAWIKYHFVSGVALKQGDLMKIPGANGFADRYVRIWVSKGKITINRICEITRFDIDAANGVIHEVTRVLDAEDEIKAFQRKAR